eukprot:NODE_21375_length_756_cov_4.278219.p1 GENE.NODE_21375_length_756_cov_4.278219~~NODE_21375_length_756_cov_4.278219.p1  ORF type:complete len:170 (-),score=67.06 NODE_21375_length_756_cov_4.278219:112-621(-)
MHKTKQKDFQARKYERPGLKQDEIEEIKEAFDLFDVDESGQIDPKELKTAMQSLGYDTRNDTIFAMLAALGKHESSSLDFEEFLDLMSCKDGKEEQDTKDEIEKIFRLFAQKDSSVIRVEDISKNCKELGERLSHDEIVEIVRRACTDETRMEITFDDFYNVMTKKTFP